MNIQTIVTVNCIGCAMLMVLLISSHIVRQRHHFSDKLFTTMILMTGCACICEAASFIIDGRLFPFAVPLAKLLNSILYILNLLESFTWCMYVDLRLYNSRERIVRIYPKIGIPLFVAAAALIFNVRHGFLFSISADNVYRREPAGYLFYAVTFVYLVYSIVIRDYFFQRYGKTRFFPIYMFILPILAASIVQFAVYGISVIWCAVALGLVGMHMCLQNELSYIDPLTRLYNRTYLDFVINNATNRGSRLSGIMVDLDYFKSINDRFGHSVGDEALRDAARILRRSAPEKSIVARFAGDEFIVVMRGGTPKEAEDMRSAVLRGLEEFNAKHERQYELSFSVGCAIYDPSEMSADRFLNVMDDNMYAEKKRKHSCRESAAIHS